MSPRRVRAAVTLVGLVVLVLVGGAWGWSALTSPFPESADDGSSDLCTDRDLAPGERLTKDQVLVSVVNAGNRSGAADQTMRRLVDAGFGEGETGNAPDDAGVNRVQIWTDDPQSPAVRLVSTWLGGNVPVKERETDAPGVYVVVGDEFGELAPGRDAVPVREAASVCSPVV